ncbi:unnamed protein product, partial [Rotaria sp. Silwood1]
MLRHAPNPNGLGLVSLGIEFGYRYSSLGMDIEF